MKKTTAMLLCSMLTLSLGTLNGCGAKSADTAISAETDKDQANAGKNTELFNDNAPDILANHAERQWGRLFPGDLVG